jgi:hypothetical protein
VGAILTLLARPLIQAAVSAFGQVLLDLLQSWRAYESAKAEGRADADRAAAAAVEAARRRMDAATLPDKAEILRRLREGDA